MPDTRITPSKANALNRACIADKMRFLNRVITNLYDESLREVGITTAQMNILVTVAKYEPASPGQVSGWLHMEKSTLSRNLDRLKKQGWLRAPRADHGRAIELSLTRKGHEVLKKGLPRWKRAQRKAESILGNTGVREVMEIAQRLRSA